MVEVAILKLGIKNELRLNPLPVQAFANDVVLSSYDIEVLHSMLHASGLEVKPSKSAVFHDRRSGNNWYKGRKNDLPEVIVQSNTLSPCNRDDYYKYLGN